MTKSGTTRLFVLAINISCGDGAEKKKDKDKKWITSELKKNIRQKERLYKKMLNSPTSYNTQQYKDYNRTLGNKLHKAEKEYYNNVMQSTNDSAIN